RSVLFMRSWKTVALMGWFFFSSRRRHTRSKRDWSSDVCSSDLGASVTLLTERTQTFIRGTQTQSNGSFLFEDLVKSKYVLRVSYVGYQTYELTDLNYQGGPRKLDSIFLKHDGEVL